MLRSSFETPISVDLERFSWFAEWWKNVTEAVTSSDFGAEGRAIPPLKAHGRAIWGKPNAHPTVAFIVA